jgi:DNA-binding transcriptional LysR family regulator
MQTLMASVKASWPVAVLFTGPNHLVGDRTEETSKRPRREIDFVIVTICDMNIEISGVRMNLRSVDLNLLVVLDALLTDLHVTRAADRIGLSQPAMSNALTGLRHIFKDELLVRTATGMKATTRALELAGQTKQVLRQIERVFESDTGFDPALSNRTFTLRLSDLLGLLFLPSLLEMVASEAPGVAFDVLHLPPMRTVTALEEDEIDLAVSMGLDHSSSIRSEVLYSDRMVCLMRKSHPLAHQPMTLEAFLEQRHLKVSMSPTDLRFVDDVLASEHRKRSVALNLPHWLLVPHVLARTNLVSVMSGRLAAAISGNTLVARDLPFASKPFEWALYWHRRHERNPAIQWIRGKLLDIAKQSEMQGFAGSAPVHSASYSRDSV